MRRMRSKRSQDAYYAGLPEWVRLSLAAVQFGTVLSLCLPIPPRVHRAELPARLLGRLFKLPANGERPGNASQAQKLCGYTTIGDKSIRTPSYGCKRTLNTYVYKAQGDKNN